MQKHSSVPGVMQRILLLVCASLPFASSFAGATLTPAWTTFGSKGGSNYGRSVAGAGDINGDGYDDVIIGSPSAGATVNVGRVSVYLGAAGGLSATPAWEKDGPGGVSWFGQVVASAGDVNGDGFADVLASAPRYRAPALDEGRVYLFLGSTGVLTDAPSWTQSGGQESAYFGRALSSAGDVNADGFSDIAVGAPLYDGAGVDDGRAVVFYGSASGLSHTPDWIVDGGQNTGFFGSAVACAGDVNADGYADLLVGEEGYGNGAQDQGRARLYLGSSGGLSTVPAWTAVGPPIYQGFFGSSLAGIGDVNGDGYDDVLILGPEYSYSQRGHAYVYLGNSNGLESDPAWVFEGHTAFDFYGSSGTRLGDLNSDGYDDFAIGEIRSSTVFLYLGNASATWPQAFESFTSDHNLDQLGASVAGVGDVDGRGEPDLLVGAPRESSAEFTNAGSARAFFGENLSTSAVEPPVAHSAGIPYPNPFRTETTIRYEAGASNSGAVTVWDASGRVMLRAGLPAGSSTWTWDGSDQSGRPLPAGVYWIGTNELRSARRVVLSR